VSAAAQHHRFGVFELDAASGELRKSGVLIRLAPQPFKLLLLLTSRPGELVSRDEIREAIWGKQTCVDFDQGLNVCMRQIRAALSDDAATPRYVETLPRRGYRFVAQVQAVGQALAPAVGPAVEPAGEVEALPAPRSGSAVRGRRILTGAAAAVAICAAAGTWMVGRNGRAINNPPVSSIAVLPFADLSPQKDQAYFCEGLAEELIYSLAQVKGLSVVARGSSFGFAGKQQDARYVGAKLGVDSVLEGSLRREGNALRITAELVDARNGYQIWSGEYDDKLENLLAVQKHVADAILLSLRVKLDRREVAVRGPANQEQVGAYELYLQGRYHSGKRKTEALKKSLEYFQEAVARDASFAPAHAGLADSYALLGNNGGMPAASAFARSRAEAMLALRLNDHLAEAHVSLGFIRWIYDADWAGAATEFRRAIELSPGFSEGHHMHAHVLQQTGHLDEALAAMKLASSLDPLSLPISEEVGHTFYLQREYDQAIQQYWKTLAIDATFVRAYDALGWAYAKKEMYTEAAAAFSKAGGVRGLSGSAPDAAAAIAYVAARAGRAKEARDWLRAAEGRSASKPQPRSLALVHLALGERDAAIEWLTKACDQRPFGANYLKSDPVWDDLRPDPRFTALLVRLKLQEHPKELSVGRD
jgi:TolB-like protein/DNA-binding winged helix-turn-helix (wHTH) protein/Tfp pilus assembly protein PilF